MAKNKSQIVKESRERAGLKSKSLYVTDADWAEVRAAAKAAGMSQGEYILHAVRCLSAADNGARAELQIRAGVATALRKMLAEVEGDT